jgi:hypothetical protein
MDCSFSEQGSMYEMWQERLARACDDMADGSSVKNLLQEIRAIKKQSKNGDYFQEIFPLMAKLKTMVLDSNSVQGENAFNSLPCELS